VLLVLASAAYVVGVTRAANMQYYALVTLVGCVVVMVRTIFNVVMFDRQNDASSSRRMPLLDTAAISCPDFWTLVRNESSQKPQCVNSFDDSTNVGKNETVTMDLAVNVGSPNNADISWTKAFCDQVKKDVADYPRTASRKLCEYMDRM
jgi:hypothetical protein